MNKTRLFFLVFCIISLAFGTLYWKSRDLVENTFYNLLNKNPKVTQTSEIDEILNGFPLIPIAELPKEYLDESKLSDATYAKMVSQTSFYKIKKKDCYRNIVGEFKIGDFISKGKDFRQTWYYSATDLYWGINPRILHKTLQLMDKLEAKGYDRNAFSINSGHRTPKENEKEGGAPKSRHILGEAVDLHIADINRDGAYSDNDKQIVIEICEKYIIGNQGGLGLYPGTNVVHMDVRGQRARWNSY